MHFKTIHIIGAGKLGQTLGFLFHRLNYSIGQVICRTLSHAEEAVHFIGAGSPQTEFHPALTTREDLSTNILMISVPDGEIAKVVKELSTTDLSQTLALHFSGSLPSTILSPLQLAGASIGSIHPLKSFAEPAEAVKTFVGTYCSFEGDVVSEKSLESLILELGGHPFAILTEQKTLYHAAAVVASNYFVGLMQFALSLYEKAGIPPEEGITPLLLLAKGTLRNMENVGLAQALTGPIQRGDLSTITKHLSALTKTEQQLYCLLGNYGLELAKHPPEIMQQLRKKMNPSEEFL